MLTDKELLENAKKSWINVTWTEPPKPMVILEMLPTNYNPRDHFLLGHMMAQLEMEKQNDTRKT